MKLIVEIASVTDGDELVAEIWADKEMVAEIRQDRDRTYRLDIYPNVSNEPWSFELGEWIQAVDRAKSRLEGSAGQPRNSASSG